MFARDLGEQGRMLMQMIGVVVANLNRVSTLVPTLHALGRRHAGYGVRDEHYDVVAGALLWTLEKGLGDAFDDQMREAWTAAYVTLAQTMQAAAQETTEAAAA
jgi:nitric oxide dioxygenase